MEYVFTDKTGTLTENNMEFIECCVDGHVYVPHAVCNGQIISGADSIDMIDSSPCSERRVSLKHARKKRMSHAKFMRFRFAGLKKAYFFVKVRNELLWYFIHISTFNQKK